MSTTLLYPKVGEDRYLFFQGSCFGPFDKLYNFSGERIPFDSELQSITQSRGIYGDNDVEHQKLSGNFSYYPMAGNAEISPILPDMPKRVLFPVIDANLTGPSSHIKAYASYGLAIPKTTSIRFTSDMKLSQQVAWIKDEETQLWSFWIVYSQTLMPSTVTNLWKYEILKVESYSGNYVWVTYRTTTYDTGQLGWDTGLDWRKLQDFETILGLQNRALRPPTVSTDRNLGQSYRADYKAQPLNPKDAKEKIDALVAQLLPGSYPIEDKHYGDLAMEASEGVNANQVNMIAFFRDLRRPQELIPKLRELRNLKGLSGNYLTAEYGILPTISDLKDIVAGLKKIGPYLDRNGFSTYTAGHSDSKKIEGLTYELEQRIKLAISNEDDMFQKIIGDIDNAGLLPTFENIWDLVPYSFVLDWFADVGDLLHRVDTNLRLLRLNIRYVTSSRKKTVKGVLPWSVESPISGSFEWVHYHRWVSDQCPVPPLSLNSPLNNAPFGHWLEGGALLVQRTR